MARVVAFRVDASITIGTGHVMRCLTLADALREQGLVCVFLCRAHPGNLIALISGYGYEVHELPSTGLTGDSEFDKQSGYASWLGAAWVADAAQTVAALRLRASGVDWMIVDHYALDARWEQVVRQPCEHLMVIDDLADRPHDCDLLLDQNLGRSISDYAQLVPEDCVVLAGPKYALLRSEFACLRPESLARRVAPRLRHVLISMGGVDKDNATGAVLAALRGDDLPEDCRITVVMGSKAPWLESVRQQIDRLPWNAELLVDTCDMARLMADSDLAIGAAGSTSWERCCMGLPTIMFVLADNQRDIGQALSNAGAAYLTDINTLKCRGLIAQDLIKNIKITGMSEAAAAVTDGLGVSRVIRNLASEATHEN